VVKTLGSLLGVSTRGKLFCGELLCGACFGSLLNSLVPGASLRHIYPVLLCFPPKKSHFHRLRTLSFHRVVCDTDCRGIIAMEGGSWLWVSQVGQSLSKNYSVLAIAERAPSSASAMDPMTKCKIVLFT
jgi:hypothetical protein